MRTTKGQVVWLVVIEQVGGVDYEIYSTRPKAERRAKAVMAAAKRDDDWDTHAQVNWMEVE